MSQIATHPITSPFGRPKISPSSQLEMSGTLLCNTISQNSDQRIKKDIEPVSDTECLSVIEQLNVVKYNYTLQPTASKVIGFIAQQVQQVLPDAVEKVTKRFDVSITQSALILSREEIKIDENTACADPFVVQAIMNLKFDKTPIPDTLHLYHYKLQTDAENVKQGYSILFTILGRNSQSEIKEDGIIEFESTSELPDGELDLTIFDITVDDFLSLSKDKIFTLTVGAIQELKAKNEALQARDSDLEARVAHLEALVAHLVESHPA